MGVKKINFIIFETQMPLIFKDKVLSCSTIAVWQIKENEQFFLNNCGDNWDGKELTELKGKRRLEWLASRFLVQKMTKKAYGIKKDKFGKPQLQPNDYQISISHSNGMVAAIVSKKRVGIDIQKKVSKIERIANKFLNSEEKSFVNNRYKISNLHLIWGAKECLFKAYGRKQVDFKKNLLVNKFTYRKNGNFIASINKSDFTYSFHFENRFFNNYYVVYGEQN